MYYIQIQHSLNRFYATHTHDIFMGILGDSLLDIETLTRFGHFPSLACSSDGS